ncbi:MAG TPA: hypothetical protein VL977_01955 [Solirubrobacteraceae bacterium]|nr:hypothetical protein [Solirubrobacteraceae bacterium]
MPIRRDRSSALCLVNPARTIRAIADSLGGETRRILVEEVVDAWVDAIPEPELAENYAKAIDGLSYEDLREVAGWPGSPGVAVAVANREFLVAAFAGLGDGRRELLRRAATLRGLAAFDAGVSEVQLLDTVLPCLAPEQLAALVRRCTELYLEDRLGSEN